MEHNHRKRKMLLLFQVAPGLILSGELEVGRERAVPFCFYPYRKKEFA